MGRVIIGTGYQKEKSGLFWFQKHMHIYGCVCVSLSSDKDLSSYSLFFFSSSDRLAIRIMNLEQYLDTFLALSRKYWRKNYLSKVNLDFILLLLSAN